ncbi:MAG: CopG family transcriptional regulator [Gammaproteobacteria bacterium]|nr:CopG family transcriptional regulator [Gammaproteobacteria bacterium]
MATSIQLTPEDEERLESLVSRTGGTKDFYLREIIERGLEDLEDYFVAADVLKRLRSESENTYTASEARKNLALDD